MMSKIKTIKVLQVEIHHPVLFSTNQRKRITSGLIIDQDYIWLTIIPISNKTEPKLSNLELLMFLRLKWFSHYEVHFYTNGCLEKVINFLRVI